MNSTISEIIRERDEVIRTVKKDLIGRLNLPYEPDDLHEDVSLLGSGLGLDSLDALEVILGIEHTFKIKIEDGNISVLRSINSIVDYVLACRRGKEGAS
jgi:acyl carrier protein